MENTELPVYEVQEVTLEEAILMMASEREKYETIYTETSERLLKMCA